MLQNEDLDSKIGVDTAENELSKVCRSKQAIPTPDHKSGSVEREPVVVIAGYAILSEVVETFSRIWITSSRFVALIHWRARDVPEGAVIDWASAILVARSRDAVA